MMRLPSATAFITLPHSRCIMGNASRGLHQLGAHHLGEHQRHRYRQHRAATTAVARRAILTLLAVAVIAGWVIVNWGTAQPAIAQQSGTAEASTLQPSVMQPDEAQQNLPDTSQAPTIQAPDFAAFWSRFKAAAQNNDLAALRVMTQLPFQLRGENFDAAGFDRLAPQLYDAQSRACLTAQQPVHDQDNYEIFCGGIVYVFGTDPDLPEDAAKASDGSGWRLLEMGAND